MKRTQEVQFPFKRISVNVSTKLREKGRFLDQSFLCFPCLHNVLLTSQVVRVKSKEACFQATIQRTRMKVALLSLICDFKDFPGDHYSNSRKGKS